MPVRADSIVFGHTSMLPSWVVQGHFSAPQLAAILHAVRGRAVVSQYRGGIAEWVVANESRMSPPIRPRLLLLSTRIRVRRLGAHCRPRGRPRGRAQLQRHDEPVVLAKSRSASVACT